jgi:hypothetical protein
MVQHCPRFGGDAVNFFAYGETSSWNSTYSKVSGLGLGRLVSMRCSLGDTCS